MKVRRIAITAALLVAGSLAVLVPGRVNIPQEGSWVVGRDCFGLDRDGNMVEATQVCHWSPEGWRFYAAGVGESSGCAHRPKVTTGSMVSR